MEPYSQGDAVGAGIKGIIVCSGGNRRSACLGRIGDIIVVAVGMTVGIADREVHPDPFVKEMGHAEAGAGVPVKYAVGFSGRAAGSSSGIGAPRA